MSKQHLTLSKGRSSTKNSFDIVAVLATKSNVASTLLLVWTGFIGEASELTGRRERRWRAGQGSSDCAATPTTAELRWCRRWRRRRSREEERYRALAAYPATASLESASLHTKYTVLRKKRDALFFTMTPAFFGGLYTFLHWWKQERTFYRKVINFNLILCLQLRQCYLQFGWPWSTASCSCVRSNWLCATLAESRPMFIFSIFFLWEFIDESSGKKSFRFPQVLIKILLSELNIIHFIVLLLCTK